MKRKMVKSATLFSLNTCILGFLIFLATIKLLDPIGVTGQDTMVIPDDSLVYQGEPANLSLTASPGQIALDCTGTGTLYLLKTDTEVLSGAALEFSIPALNIHTDVTETSTGAYALDLSGGLTVAADTPSDMDQWQIQLLEYSARIRDNQSKAVLDAFPASIADIDAGLNILLSQLPQVDYIANANIASIPENLQAYNFLFSMSAKAKILDKDGNPLANSALSMTFNLPDHNYSDTVTLYSDNDGIVSYSRSETAIVKVSGGQIATLGQPIYIKGTHHALITWWWEPDPPQEEGKPPRDNQNKAGEPEQQENIAAEDPINLTTGNVYSIEQDLFIPGKGLPVQFLRTYNSQVDYQGPLGFGWTHSYNIYLEEQDNGNIEERDEDGTLLTFVKNDDGSYKSPAGNHSKLTKNLNGDTVTYTITRKHGEVLSFNSPGRLISIEDTNENKVELFYDLEENLVTIIDTSSRYINIVYDDQGRINQLTDPLDRRTTYTYDVNNNLSSVTDPLGKKTTYEYNQYHCIKTVIDPQRGTQNGEPVHSHRYFSYNLDGKCTEFKYDGDNHKITLEYVSDGQTDITDSKGNKTSYYYQDFSGITIVTKIIDPDGGTQLFARDNDLNKTSYTDQNGYVTNMVYDSIGNLTSITDPLNNTTRFTYESRYNKCSSITDALLHTTGYFYDSFGNLTEVKDARGNLTQYTYNSSSNLTNITDAKEHSTSYAYDAHGNLTTATDPLGNSTMFAYDLAGNCIGIIDAKNNTISFTYDDLNRLAEITYPDGTKVNFTYDALGNRTSIQDPNENITGYAYDTVNRLAQVTDPLGNTTYYSYDTEGNTIAATDANGNTTRYTYDSLNKLTQVTTPSLNATSFVYDAAGNRISVTDANENTIKYTYDEANRLAGITYPDSSQASFICDATGKRISMTDNQGTTDYRYDDLNQLITVDGPEADDTVTYTYDNAGNRITMTDQNNGVTTYQYDALNRLVSITNPEEETTNYSYDDVNNLTGTTCPNGTQAAYAYNNLNRLISLINTGNKEKVLSSFSYEYDFGGMRTKTTLENSDYITYTYDELNRLTSEIGTNGNSGTTRYGYTYTFDAAGNRTSMERNLCQRPLFSQKGGGGLDIEKLPGTNMYYYKYDKENRLLKADIVWERQTAAPPEAPGKKEARFKEGEVLVKFMPEVSEETIEAINNKYGTFKIKKIPHIGVYRLIIPGRISPEEMAAGYLTEPDVLYAEPNYIAYATLIPDDADFLEKQWALNNTGQTGGVLNADIDAPEAWDVETGDPAVIIAIVDTGVDYNHPDLAGKVISGYDFVHNDDDPVDDAGHGTYCAGIVAAETDNGTGIAGVSWHNKIMPVKVLNSLGSGSYDNIAHGIIYSADNGAHVISLSLGGSAHSQTLENAMEHAYNMGVVICCATGNDGGPVGYPAAYDSYCLGVAATDHNDARAVFSNFGPEVDCAAPGVDIYSAWLGGTYETHSGTSASTPFVSGLAGLIISKYPDLTNDEVMDLIKSTAEDVNSFSNPGDDPYLGSGRINAYNALTGSTAPDIEPELPVWAAIEYEYDNNGNQIRKAMYKAEDLQTATTYQYDYDNRLVAIAHPDGTTSQYVYDGVGRRIESDEEGAITRYLYDGLTAIIERGASNVTYTRGLGYGGGIGSIISASRDNETTYYHYNGIGAVTELTNSRGQAVQSYVYDGYGNILEANGIVANQYGFSTKEYSSKSGLVYFGARYYDPRTGRFITKDPLTWGPDDPRGFNPRPDSTIALIQHIGRLSPQMSHRYTYCLNNPIMFIDPWGLCTQDPDFSDLKPGADSSSGPMAFYGAGASLVIIGGDLAVYGAGMIATGGPVGWIGGTIVTGTGIVMWGSGIWTAYHGWRVDHNDPCL